MVGVEYKDYCDEYHSLRPQVQPFLALIGGEESPPAERQPGSFLFPCSSPHPVEPKNHDDFAKTTVTTTSPNPEDAILIPSSIRTNNTNSTNSSVMHNNHNNKGGRKRNKKPKDRPKRPLSAYNIFFAHEKQRIFDMQQRGLEQPDFDQLEAASTSGASPSDSSPRLVYGRVKKRVAPILFSALGKCIGARWRALSETDRLQYKELAEEEMKKYRLKMKEYHDLQQQQQLLEKQQKDAANASNSKENNYNDNNNINSKRKRYSPANDLSTAHAKRHADHLYYDDPHDDDEEEEESTENYTHNTVGPGEETLVPNSSANHAEITTTSNGVHSSQSGHHTSYNPYYYHYYYNAYYHHHYNHHHNYRSNQGNNNVHTSETISMTPQEFHPTPVNTLVHPTVAAASPPSTSGSGKGEESVSTIIDMPCPSSHSVPHPPLYAPHSGPPSATTRTTGTVLSHFGYEKANESAGARESHGRRTNHWDPHNGSENYHNHYHSSCSQGWTDHYKNRNWGTTDTTVVSSSWNSAPRARNATQPRQPRTGSSDMVAL